jgi:hypothetical protein
MRHLELAVVTRRQRSLHPAWRDDNRESDLARPLALVSAVIVAFGASSLVAFIVVLVR